jgi:UDPglucose 6-dehydrogenase
MKLTMVGAGYVGLVTGVCFSNTGNDVICLDVDPKKVDAMRRGECPIYEPGLTEMMRLNIDAGRLSFTTDPKQAYRDAEMIFICVGTPTAPHGGADLQYIFSAADDVADAILDAGPDAPPKVVVVKSTVPVGTTLKVKQRIRERVGDTPFEVANNPEFLKEGAAIVDFTKPDRVVCGVESERVGQMMQDLYSPFVRQGNPIYVMDILSSEMVKYASNNFLATKISFINEMARLCEAYGADVERVRQGMCADVRIGKHFLYPGLGYGGSCFPKDTLACIAMGREADSPTILSEAVHQVNQAQRSFFFSKIQKHFADDAGLAGKTIAFWGLAFKPNTDDIREAPALTLIEHALNAGASCRGHDPVAADNVRRLMGDRISLHANQYDALEGADALVISTDWDEFKSPNFRRMKETLTSPVIFDGRNLYSLDTMAREGFTYHSVGRPSIERVTSAV